MTLCTGCVYPFYSVPNRVDAPGKGVKLLFLDISHA